MLTRNFYILVRAFAQEQFDNYKLTDGSTATAQISGTSSYSGPFDSMRFFSSTATKYGVCFGTGTIAPTLNDYCLEKPILSGLTVTTPSAAAYNRTDDYEEYVATYGVSSANDVTISEIGLIFAPYEYGSTHHYALAEHTILKDPIEIKAGESKQITYTIRMNYPTA